MDQDNGEEMSPLLLEVLRLGLHVNPRKLVLRISAC